MMNFESSHRTFKVDQTQTQSISQSGKHDLFAARRESRAVGKSWRCPMLPHVPFEHAAQRAYAASHLLDDLQPRSLVSYFIPISSRKLGANKAQTLIIKNQSNNVNTFDIMQAIPDTLLGR